jgi:UDP-glucose 4-epimerase
LALRGSDDVSKPYFHEADLTNATELDAAFAQYEERGRIWGVIHLAALKAVGQSAEVPLDYYSVNVTGSIELLKVSCSANQY